MTDVIKPAPPTTSGARERESSVAIDAPSPIKGVSQREYDAIYAITGSSPKSLLEVQEFRRAQALKK